MTTVTNELAILKANNHFEDIKAIEDEAEALTIAQDGENARQKINDKSRQRQFTFSDVKTNSTSKEYYSAKNHANSKAHNRTKTFSAHSMHGAEERHAELRDGNRGLLRRNSHDEKSTLTQRFVVNVQYVIDEILKYEDMNGNYQITIDDMGSKLFRLGTQNSDGHKKFEIRGQYAISNLLQEMSLAKLFGRTQVVIDLGRLNENPVNRLRRLIRDEFWDNLTRKIDGENIQIAGKDPKDWTENPRPRVYVPSGAPDQYEYYTQVAEDNPEYNLEVCWLPEPITPESIRDMNAKPGLLAIEVDTVIDRKTGKKTLEGLPFVVPGGRFNELYGWDSYFESIGLILSNKVHLAKAMVRHFCFCIKHYGKILNANRSYYLGRSQPPFLTDMALRVYGQIKHHEGSKDFLRESFQSAIKEYYSVWMAAPRFDPATGLSRYRPEGLGVPPETEESHFEHILEPYVKKHGLTHHEFVKRYNSGEIKEPVLDEYFMHDRAVRESGHDTTYRLEGNCADLATIDLNSLLFKYEKDIAKVIKEAFDDKFVMPAEFCVGGREAGYVETSASWEKRARLRRDAMTRYLWNESSGQFIDYNTVSKKQITYESATTFWALWAGCASPRQAQAMVERALPKLEQRGGLSAGTEKSRGIVGLDRPSRQWDHPYGWAPQQMLAWEGLRRYGYESDAERLAYKWLFMMTRAFVDYNGVVVEKYNVCVKSAPHKVDAEYGNQGLAFKGVALEGFGWVNASYLHGLTFMDVHKERTLGTLTDWETFARMTASGSDSGTPSDPSTPSEAN